MKYVFSASVLFLALAILTCLLIPRYYLIVVSADSPLVQMGPFATQAGCESARHRIPDAMFGNSDLTHDQSPTYANGREKMTQFMVCVPSR